MGPVWAQEQAWDRPWYSDHRPSVPGRGPAPRLALLSCSDSYIPPGMRLSTQLPPRRVPSFFGSATSTLSVPFLCSGFSHDLALPLPTSIACTRRMQPAWTPSSEKTLTSRDRANSVLQRLHLANAIPQGTSRPQHEPTVCFFPSAPSHTSNSHASIPNLLCESPNVQTNVRTNQEGTCTQRSVHYPSSGPLMAPPVPGSAHGDAPIVTLSFTDSSTSVAL